MQDRNQNAISALGKHLDQLESALTEIKNGRSPRDFKDLANDASRTYSTTIQDLKFDAEDETKIAALKTRIDKARDSLLLAVYPAPPPIPAAPPLTTSFPPPPPIAYPPPPPVRDIELKHEEKISDEAKTYFTPKLNVVQKLKVLINELKDQINKKIPNDTRILDLLAVYKQIRDESITNGMVVALDTPLEQYVEYSRDRFIRGVEINPNNLHERSCPEQVIIDRRLVADKTRDIHKEYNFISERHRDFQRNLITQVKERDDFLLQLTPNSESVILETPFRRIKNNKDEKSIAFNIDLFIKKSRIIQNQDASSQSTAIKFNFEVLFKNLIIYTEKLRKGLKVSDDDNPILAMVRTFQSIGLAQKAIVMGKGGATSILNPFHPTVVIPSEFKDFTASLEKFSKREALLAARKKMNIVPEVTAMAYDKIDEFITLGTGLLNLTRDKILNAKPALNQLKSLIQITEDILEPVAQLAKQKEYQNRLESLNNLFDKIKALYYSPASREALKKNPKLPEITLLHPNEMRKFEVIAKEHQIKFESILADIEINRGQQEFIKQFEVATHEKDSLDHLADINNPVTHFEELFSDTQTDLTKEREDALAQFAEDKKAHEESIAHAAEAKRLAQLEAERQQLAEQQRLIEETARAQEQKTQAEAERQNAIRQAHLQAEREHQAAQLQRAEEETRAQEQKAQVEAERLQSIHDANLLAERTRLIEEEKKYELARAAVVAKQDAENLKREEKISRAIDEVNTLIVKQSLLVEALDNYPDGFVNFCQTQAKTPISLQHVDLDRLEQQFSRAKESMVQRENLKSQWQQFIRPYYTELTEHLASLITLAAQLQLYTETFNSFLPIPIDASQEEFQRHIRQNPMTAVATVIREGMHAAKEIQKNVAKGDDPLLAAAVLRQNKIQQIFGALPNDRIFAVNSDLQHKIEQLERVQKRLLALGELAHGQHTDELANSQAEITATQVAIIHYNDPEDRDHKIEQTLQELKVDASPTAELKPQSAFLSVRGEKSHGSLAVMSIGSDTKSANRTFCSTGATLSRLGDPAILFHQLGKELDLGKIFVTAIKSLPANDKNGPLKNLFAPPRDDEYIKSFFLKYPECPPTEAGIKKYLLQQQSQNQLASGSVNAIAKHLYSHYTKALPETLRIVKLLADTLINNAQGNKIILKGPAFFKFMIKSYLGAIKLLLKDKPCANKYDWIDTADPSKKLAPSSDAIYQTLKLLITHIQTEDKSLTPNAARDKLLSLHSADAQQSNLRSLAKQAQAFGSQSEQIAETLKKAAHSEARSQHPPYRERQGLPHDAKKLLSSDSRVVSSEDKKRLSH